MALLAAILLCGSNKKIEYQPTEPAQPAPKLIAADPERFKNVLTLGEVSTDKLWIGWINFGTYAGRKIVPEQNGCPLNVYWKAEE